MSDDLISRKALIHALEAGKDKVYEGKTILEVMKDIVNEQETAFDKGKVIEKMKKTGKRFCVSVRCSKDCQNCEHGVLMKALIEIVEKGGIGGIE